jgi:hypothetical protein
MMKWQGREVAMKPANEPFSLFVDPNSDDVDDLFATDIKRRKYEEIDIKEINQSTTSPYRQTTHQTYHCPQ